MKHDFLRAVSFVGTAVFVLSLVAVVHAADKAKGETKANTFTMGLIYQKPRDPVPEGLKAFVNYLARQLSSTPGLEGNIVVAPNSAQMVKLLEEKRVDFYMESPYPTYLINRNGSGRLLLRRWKGGLGAYHSVIFTSRKSGVSSTEDLRGKMIAFEDAGSTSGYFLPKLFLLNKKLTLAEKPAPNAKVSAGEVGYIFAGSDKTILNLVLARKVTAGAVSDDDYAQVGAEEKSSLSVLAETESFPRHLLSIRKDLPAPIAGRLKEVLLAMDGNAEGRMILQHADNTTKFDLLPGGEEAVRRKLLELFRRLGTK